MTTTRSRKWGETLAEPEGLRKGADHEFLDAVQQFLPDLRAGAFCIELFDAVQHDAGQRSWIAAMDQAGRSLRGARSLHSSERRFVGDALHELVRGLRRLRAIAGERRPTATQLYLTWLIDGLTTQRADALPSTLVRAAERAGLSVPALLERRARLGERLAAAASLSSEEQIDAIGEALSYPSWIVRALRDDLGLGVALDVLREQNRRAPLTVRANALRCDRDTLAERLRGEGLAVEPTGLSAHGLSIDGRVNVYGTQAFADGLVEIQDEGSQLIAELCAPPPGSVVVDLCAGAGGKTLALGAMLGNKGRIVALDVDGRKLEELQKRARRAGLSNVQAVCLREDWATAGGTGELPEWLRLRGAERVLVDAPCSGLGVLRRHPEARWHLQPRDVEELTAKQRAILSAAAALTRGDGRGPGRLIYATCTLLRRENDDIVDGFLASHPDFAPLATKEILGSERASRLGDGLRLRLRPTAGGPDGFFAAVMRHTDRRPAADIHL